MLRHESTSCKRRREPCSVRCDTNIVVEHVREAESGDGAVDGSEHRLRDAAGVGVGSGQCRVCRTGSARVGIMAGAG